MTGRTHDLAAFTALTIAFVYAPVIPAISLPTAILAFSANFMGGLFPDVDQPTSDLWDNFRLGPEVGKVVCHVLGGHRHISHSIIGTGLAAILSHWVILLGASYIKLDLNVDVIWSAFMLGYLSHIIADLFTKEGNPLFWPIMWKVGIPPIKAFRIDTGKFMEKVVIFPGLLIFTGYLIYTHQERVLTFLHQYLK